MGVDSKSYKRVLNKINTCRALIGQMKGGAITAKGVKSLERNIEKRIEALGEELDGLSAKERSCLSVAEWFSDAKQYVVDELAMYDLHTSIEKMVTVDDNYCDEVEDFSVNTVDAKAIKRKLNTLLKLIKKNK